MSVHKIRAATALALLALAGCGDSAPPPTATAMNVDDFRRELVNLPLCGKPTTGPLAGKAMCTVHSSDGSATLAGVGTGGARGVGHRRPLDLPPRRQRGGEPAALRQL